MRKAMLVVVFVLVGSCSSGDDPVSLSGGWFGSTAGGYFLTLTLVQSGASVGGTGDLTNILSDYALSVGGSSDRKLPRQGHSS